MDFGFADVVVNGQLTKVALFVMTLPYSDAIFIQAFPRECTESFLEGHVRAFAFFGGVPMRISYDNSRIAVGTAWRGEYNKVCPHSSLGYQTPADFARVPSCGNY